MVRVGVLGCASIAWRRTLPAIAEAAGIAVTAVASRDPARARAFAERFGCVPVDGYQALLERPDIDAVYIPLPTGLHADWVRQSLAAGKHVLVEKPLTASYQEAEALVGQASSAGLWLMENFTFLHHAQHLAVQKIITDGRIGEPRVLTASFGFPPLPPDDVRYRPELGGGALLDVGVYPIRAAQLLLGADIEVVGAVRHEDPSTGVDIAGTALLSAGPGAAAQLSFGFTHSYRCRYELWGSRGHLCLDRAFTPGPDWRPVIRIESQDHAEELTLPADYQFRNTAESFAQSVLAQADFAPQAQAILSQARLVASVASRAVRARA
jgi:NDP-hexose-3-ketoreductase